jgi:hypothetical protein
MVSRTGIDQELDALELRVQKARELASETASEIEKVTESIKVAQEQNGLREVRWVEGDKKTLGVTPNHHKDHMHILIENNDTHEFLTTPGKWTKNPLQAKHFPATGVAFRAARQEQIGKFTIVFHITQTNQFVNLDHGRGAGSSDTGGVEVPNAAVTEAA